MPRRIAWLLLSLTLLLLLTGCWGSGLFSRSEKETSAPPETTAQTTPTPVPAQAPEPAPVTAGSTLAVGLPNNDCVNLRAKPSKQGAVLACIYGTSTVTATLPTGATSLLSEGEGEVWVHIRTASGQEGWAAMQAGMITPAPAK